MEQAARTALCMDCRTALRPGETCDAHRHAAVLDLADAPQRARAVDAVWGPPHVRVRQAAKVGSVGGGGAGLFEGLQACEGCTALEGELAAAVIVIVIAAIAAVVLYYVIRKIVYWVRAYRNRPRPTGSRWQPPRPHRALRGTIRDAKPATAPLSKTESAWGVALVHDRAIGGKVMLRDGACAGLTIALDDGRTVELAAGRLRVEGPSSREDVPAEYLRSIDPSHAPDDAEAVLAHDRGREIRIAVGDTVEIVGGLEEQFDPNAAAGYRESAATQLVVTGMPTLSRVEPAA